MQSRQPKMFIPYGGPGGYPFDITTPTTLVSVEVWSHDSSHDGVINGISFIYIDEKGQRVYSGPWGSKTGKHKKIDVGDEERMIRVSGTTDGTYVKSLTLVVTKKTAAEPHGTLSFFGAHLEDGLGSFSFPPNIVGFFGRCSDKLDAIGAYSIPSINRMQACMQYTQPKKIGPCGGPGGDPFDITMPTAFVSVQVWSNDSKKDGVINSISFTYINEKGQPVSSGPWGSETGNKHPMINLGEDERMIGVSGTTDGKYVTSLKFVTNKDEYGPYGAQSEEGKSTFSFPTYILGFFGRSSDKLSAIGAYVIPA